MAKRGAISVEITGEYNNRDVKRAINDLQLLQKNAGVTGGAMSRLGVAGVAMGAALGAAATAAVSAGARMAVQFGVDGVKAFLDDEAAAAKLARTMQNLGMEQATSAIEGTIDALQRQTGVADDVLRPAMDRLLRSTRDTALATDTLKLAMDISAGTGKSLEAVVAALGRGFDGSTAGLSRLGAGLDTATLKTGNMDVITQKLADTFSGQAAVKAASFQGQLDRLSVGFSELQESFGRGFMQGVVSGFNNSETAADSLSESIKLLEPTFFELGKQIGGVVQYVPQFVAGVKVIVNGMTVIRESVLLAFKALLALNQARQFDFSGALKTLQDGGERVATSFGAMLESAANVAGLTFEKPLTGAQRLAIAAEAARDNITAMRDASAGAASSASAQAAGNERIAASAGAATEKVIELTREQRNLALQMAGSQSALQQAKTDLDALREASTAYAGSIGDAIKGTVSLSEAFTAAQQASRDNTLAAGESIVSTTIASFRAQITAAKAFADSLTAVAGAGGSQALIDQLLTVAASEGPGAGAFLANELVAGGLVPQITADLAEVNVFAGATGEAMAKTFYDQGIVDAVALLNGLSAEVAAQEKQLNRLGKNIGEPVAEKIREEISSAIREGIADGRAAAATARARAAAAEFTRVTGAASTPTTVPAAVFTGGGMINIPGRASGGPVRAGSPYMVGERGPELFTPGSSGMITPNSGLGGNNYSITVQAGVGDPRAIGQQIVEYVRRFEQASGPVFAAA